MRVPSKSTAINATRMMIFSSTMSKLPHDQARWSRMEAPDIDRGLQRDQRCEHAAHRQHGQRAQCDALELLGLADLRYPRRAFHPREGQLKAMCQYRHPESPSSTQRNSRCDLPRKMDVAA